MDREQSTVVARGPIQPTWSEFHVIGVVLILTFSLLALLRLNVPPWAYYLWLFAGIGLLAFIVLPQLGIDLVGPVSYFDVLRLTRRRRMIALRVLYVAFLFVGLGIAFHRYFPQVNLLHWHDLTVSASPQQLAEFTTWFVQVAFQLQNAAILLLTPAYVAGAIAGEKEQGTLPMLLTTPLRDQEIVVGKLASRLAHLLAVLLAGLPVLSFTQLWGGVDLNVLLGNFTISAFGLLVAGGITISCSVVSRTTLGALLTSYGWILTFSIGFFCLPLSVLTSPIGCQTAVYLGGAFGAGYFLLIPYCLVQSLVFFCTVTWATGKVRKFALVTPTIPPQASPRSVSQQEASAPRKKQRDREHVIGDDPILWKELRIGHGDAEGELMLVLAIMLACLIPLALVFGFLTVLAFSQEHAFHFMQREGNGMVRVLTILLLVVLLVATGFRAANTFCRERAQKTLESLLLLPLSRWQLLRSKWLGCLLRWRYVAMGVAGIAVLGMVATALHPLAMIVLPLLGLAHVLMLASVGVWISLISRNTTWANLAMAAFLIFYFLGSFQFLAMLDLLLVGFGITDAREASKELLGLVCNPFQAWWAAGFSWEEFAEGRVDAAMPSLLLGLILHLVSAALFFVLAWLRLEAEGRRRVRP